MHPSAMTGKSTDSTSLRKSLSDRSPFCFRTLWMSFASRPRARRRSPGARLCRPLSFIDPVRHFCGRDSRFFLSWGNPDSFGLPPNARKVPTIYCAGAWSSAAHDIRPGLLGCSWHFSLR